MKPFPLALLMALIALAAAPGANAAISQANVNYDLGSPPAPAPAQQNYLDIYRPDGSSLTDSRPVVVYVHGGGWRIGDKDNQLADKVNLFTGAGYVFVSINYRLSPTNNNYDPGRIRFPDHPDDVGEAIGWIDRNIGAYGGDSERLLLIGHSAGAHLMSLVTHEPGLRRALRGRALAGDRDGRPRLRRLRRHRPDRRAVLPAGRSRDLLQRLRDA